MKKMRSSLFVVAACAGAMFFACSESSDDLAGGAVEDMGIVAQIDTVFVHDSIKVKVKDTVKVKVKDTVVVKDTVNSKDTVVVKDTVNSKDTVVVKDTVNTKDTVVVRDTVSSKDTAYVLKKGSVSGVAQKGPFVKGSSVKLFELDGRDSLKQTGRSFKDSVSSDDGSFKIKNVSLVSPYVLVTATGAYRQEIDGKKSGSSITLRALSKVGGSNTTVNVNLITHLEYERVVYLLKKDSRMDLSEAKRRAEKEIFAIFNIDADSFGYSEDMDIFGAEEADAALLAVSVMLSADHSAQEIADRLTAISEDLAKDGTWDDEDTQDSIATWAMNADLDGTLSTIRSNVASWKVGENVPDFEKYVRKFWSERFGIGECGEGVSVGTVKTLPDGVVADNGKSRYICVDSVGVGMVWRVAGDIEADTMGLGRGYSEGYMRKGLVNTGATYVFDNGAFRLANSRELYLNKGCTKKLQGTSFEYGHSAFVCSSGLWEFDLDNTEKGNVVDMRDTTNYKTVGIGNQVWMSENVRNFFYNVDLCFLQEAANCMYNGATMPIYVALDGRLITDSATFANPPKGLCGGSKLDNCVLKDEHQGICPHGFHIPSWSEFQELIEFVDLFNGSESVATSLKSKSGWADTKKNGTDRFGFNAFPAGWENFNEDYSGREVHNSGVEAMFWVKPESKNSIHNRTTYFRVSDTAALEKFDNNLEALLYVRCVENRSK